MSRNGAGVYSLPEAAFVYNTVISETAMNSNLSDIASALTASIAKDGQTTPTADLPMGGYNHTGVDDADARDQYAAAGQVQDGAFIWCGTAGGTADAITLTPSPAITAYATGQEFRWKASSSANTGAATVAISGLTTKALEINDAALTAGQHAANKYYRGIYDGTAFQIEQISATVALSDPMTTRGDMIRRGASATERFAIGADNTLLTSDGTDPGWETLTSLLDAALSSTQGVVLYRDSSAWAALGVGTSGQYLQTQGAAANPQWASITNGGLVPISQATASSDASIDFDSDLTDTYDNYMLVISGLRPATDNVQLWMRFKRDGQGSFDNGASDYNWGVSGFSCGAGVSRDGSFGDTKIVIGDSAGVTSRSDLGSAAAEHYDAVIYLHNVRDTSALARITGEAIYDDSGAEIVRIELAGRRETAAALQGFQILTSSGNITEGDFRLYGIANS